MKPEVSIIMPVLNGKRYIAEAIDSILAQTYGNYELIVVDDGSTDGTYERVAPFRQKLDLKYVRHPMPRGIAASMNDGLRHSSGEFVSFLDHDDGWFPDFLETQVTYLREHPDVRMVHSDFQTIDAEGNVIEESVARCRGRKRPSGFVFPALFMDSFIVGNSVLIRRECFERLGMFDESLRWGDYHMWMRIARHYRIDYVPQVLTKYRQHASQSTRTVSVTDAGEDPVAVTAIKKIVELYPEIRNEFGEQKVRRRIAAIYLDMASTLFTKGAFHNVRACLRKAIRLWPTNSRYYILYGASFLRPSHAMAARDGWHRVRGLIVRENRAQRLWAR